MDKKLLKTVVHLNGDYTIERLLEIIKQKETIAKEEEPILIGYLARKMGENGFKTLEVGTPIHSFQGYYFMDMENETTGKIKRVKYYPHSFSEDAINFVVRETK